MKKLVAVLLAGAMVLSLAACGGKEKTDLETVQDNGKLVVGITDYAPMDYKDADGNWIGFDADLATKFAESLGVEVEFQEIAWDDKVLELDGKSVDCIWNGMTLSAEVTEAMDCTEPYCNNTQVVIVPADKAADVTDVDSIKDLTLAVEAGSAGAEVGTGLELTIKEVTAQSDALMEAAGGTCDGAIVDSLMAQALVGEGTSYENLAVTIKLNEDDAEVFGVGFRKGSDLTAKLNEFFDACYEDGTIAELAETYKLTPALIQK